MHTQERQFTLFCILQLIYKEDRTKLTIFSKPNQIRVFSQNRTETELEKSIPHIYSFMLTFGS